MDQDFYKAAQSGNWEAMKNFPDDFHSHRTANGNTILHILAQSGDSSADAVKQILARKPDLIFKKNVENETPLVIASRRGNPNIVRAIIDRAKASGAKRLQKTLGALDKDGNTAVHEAVRNNHFDIVKLLVEEDPEFYYGRNFSVESPLYLAVENGNHDIVSLMVGTCKRICTFGPGRKTALHSAAIRNSSECMKLILMKMPYLTKAVDVFGWSALHYAAKFNHTELVRLLLVEDRSMGYLVAKPDDSKTALHVATISGHIDVVRQILAHCPDCWEAITRKRQNMLHLAVQNEQKEVLEFILGSSWASELINKKDVKGNNPLHLYVATKNLEGYNLVNHPCTDKNAFNNDGFTPLDIISQEADDKVTTRQASIRDELIKAGATPGLRNVIAEPEKASQANEAETKQEDYMVVATLIVTVTFAAGFTVPGGFDTTKGNEGMAVLSKKAAFTAFVVSDSLAMVFSVIAVLQHFAFKDNLIVPQSLAAKLKGLPRVNNASYIALALTLMVIAFLTGLYVVLPIRAIKIYLIVVGSVICTPFPGILLISFLRLIVTALLRIRGLESQEEMNKRFI